MMLGWLTLCERQDAERAKHGRGLNSMMLNGRSMDGGFKKTARGGGNYFINQWVEVKNYLR